MKIGVALGSGSARGFSHIGILEVLLENGIVPEVVAGCSIGAIVGAAYAGGNLDRIKAEALAINRLNWTQFFNPSFSFDRWINLKHMQMWLVKSGIPRKKLIEELEIPFGSVTCDLQTGKEIWCTEGAVFDAVWPSMAMPGVFPPVAGPDGRWLIDGGLVNPVPVSLCRALGADIVIAVNLNADLLNARCPIKTKAPVPEAVRAKDKKIRETALLDRVYQKARNFIPTLAEKEASEELPEPPDFFSTIGRSINIVQDRITKSRLAGDPPEIILAPRLGHIGLFETYRAEEIIAEGRRCCERVLPQITDLIEANRS